MRLLGEPKSAIGMYFYSPLVSIFSLSVFILWLSATDANSADEIDTLFHERKIFDAAVAAIPPRVPNLDTATGLIVPHHLLAADMIAEAFARVGRRTYRRIILVSPDSHQTATLPYHVSPKRFRTVYGLTTADEEGAEAIGIGHADDDSLFRREHGLHAILPFIVRQFPHTPVLPVVLNWQISHKEVDELFQRIRHVAGPNTLTILSIDFSHFLPLEQAIERDQETLNVLAAGDYAAIAQLRQPDHLDNRAGLLLMLLIQRGLDASLSIINNRNSQAYSTRRSHETTSYITGIFEAEPGSPPSADLCLGGDLFLGRGMTPYIDTADKLTALARMVRDGLPRCPLIVNLEGVLAAHPVIGEPDLTLWASQGQTLKFLREIGVVGVSVANNHAMDLGRVAYDEMVQVLRRNGLAVLEHGLPERHLGVTFVALTERTRIAGKAVAADMSLIDLRDGGLRPPIVALPHWGIEWQAFPGARQEELLRRLRDLGVTGVFGAHPHVASSGLTADPGGRQVTLYSMGNLLFDQLSPPASGGIVLLDVFDQGTFFARSLDVDGYFSELEGE